MVETSRSLNIKGTIVRQTIKLNPLYTLSTMINIFHDIVRMFPMKSVHIIHVSRYNLVAKVSSFRTIGYGEIYMPNVGIRTLRADEIIMGQFNVTPLASGLK